MNTYAVQHLDTGKTFERDSFLWNSHHKQDWNIGEASPVGAAVEDFHKTLPDYGETKLHSLITVAEELGFAHVFLKDESTRFGLPAFKILGASWATHRSLCQQLQLNSTASLDEVRDALHKTASDGESVRLVTCTEGNWGRACARMSKIYGIACTIYVPGFMSNYTRNLLREEGADVKVLEDGSYDDTIAASREDATGTGALLIMDTSFDSYEVVPQWVTDGYHTMLVETDRQVAALTNGSIPNTMFVSVGVGSWAHSVISHYRSANTKSRIIAVEPPSAASFKESLHCGQITPVKTGDTIMAGMNCGTTSKIAWPVLKEGVIAAITVTDWESHKDVQFLQGHGISAGPCGAATLAALRKYANMLSPEQRGQSIVVLFSTEGWRDYDIPNELSLE